MTTSCRAHASSTETSVGMPIDTLANGPPCTYTGEPFTVSVSAGLTASASISVIRHRSMKSPNSNWFAGLRAGDHRGHALAELASIERDSTTICISSDVGVSTTFSATLFLPASTVMERERAGRHFGDARHADRVDTSLVHSLLGEGDSAGSARRRRRPSHRTGPSR